MVSQDVLSRSNEFAGQLSPRSSSQGMGPRNRIMSDSSALRRRRRSTVQKVSSLSLRFKRRVRISKKDQGQDEWRALPGCVVATRADTITSSSLAGKKDVKHKIFLSHSGAQKNFTEQLCLDLERSGFLWPFFDKRVDSLPKGEAFVPHILEAARQCHVAVIVLSEEFFLSKWPMLELAEFVAAQEGENSSMKILPLFYKLSPKDLDERAIEERWMPAWEILAGKDVRIDVAKWKRAVQALRKFNGHVFGEKGPSEVAYRKVVVESIFRLSPPDLMYGSSRKMVGYSRVCKTVRDRFVRGSSEGPLFLGLYGTIGAGKTVLSKALCDFFCTEYMGRVCRVDLGEDRRMGRVKRVKRILERLCGFNKKALHKIPDFDQGLRHMREHMKREPVLLAIDNVTNENRCWDEAHKYLEVGFHPNSRVVITSRSRHNVSDLVPGIPFCVPTPGLSVTEAGELFLRSAAPSKSISELTAQEQRIVELCVEQCLYYDPDQGGLDRGGLATLIGEDEVGRLSEVHADNLWRMSPHPMALSALGGFFRRYFRYGNMLQWMGYLEENKDPLQGVWAMPEGIGDGFGDNIRSQLHSLPSSEQLLFLYIVSFSEDVYDGSDHDLFTQLCKVHDQTEPVMKRRLQDLERIGMITLDCDNNDAGVSHISVNSLYRRYTKWYMKQNMKRMYK